MPSNKNKVDVSFADLQKWLSKEAKRPSSPELGAYCEAMLTILDRYNTLARYITPIEDALSTLRMLHLGNGSETSLSDATDILDSMWELGGMIDSLPVGVHEFVPIDRNELLSFYHDDYRFVGVPETNGGVV